MLRRPGGDLFGLLRDAVLTAKIAIRYPLADVAASFARTALGKIILVPGPLPQAPPTVRDVTDRLVRHPDSLTEDDRPRLKAVLDRCPEFRAASGQVRAAVRGVNPSRLPMLMPTIPSTATSPMPASCRAARCSSSVFCCAVIGMPVAVDSAAAASVQVRSAGPCAACTWRPVESPASRRSVATVAM